VISGTLSPIISADPHSDTDGAEPSPTSQDSTADQGGGDLGLEIEVEGAADPTPEQRIAELEAKQKDTHDRLLRALADHENHKKRVKKELDEARTESQSRVLREMLPVVDNLERAVAHANQGSDAQGIIEGVQLVLRQFAQAFERIGVVAIEAKGQPFDPNLHEAVAQLESADQPPGTVVDVLQTGYKIGERLLRPTLAVVSKAPAVPAGEGGAEA
jgi:molecular chaperone GrpE